MAVNAHIIGKDKKQADIIEKDGKRGIYVVSNDLKNLKNRSSFFVNPSYGSNMNRDFSIVQTAENVHNGNDNTYWTATIITGQPSDFNFSSITQAHTGTQSINCVPSEAGDSFQLEDEAVLHSGGDYNRFIGWVYVDGNWVNRNSNVYIILYNTNLGLQVSSETVNLDNYVDGSNVGEWQRFNIPMTDFGNISDDFNAIRFTIGTSISVPDFYLDDLVLEDLGANNNIFSIKPPVGKWWYVDGIAIAIVSSYNSSLTDSSVPNIPYNGLLGVPLLNGIQYQRVENGETQFTFSINNLIDIVNQYNGVITNSGYDGNYTWIKVDIGFKYPFLLKSETEDHVSFTLSDDLSGLQYFRTVASIGEENRNLNIDGYEVGDQ